jgi:hypothetical protein
LSGAVVGSVKVLQAGDTLMKFTKTFPTTVGTALATATATDSGGSITAQPGEFYVAVALDLTIAANAAANVNVGTVGIQGSVGTNDTFSVQFFKKVDASTALKDALIAAFAGFVLPLHANTYNHLQPDDYLYHQFNASLNLGFGATLGLDKVYFSGQYASDLAAAGAPKINSSAKVELKAGATFGTTFKYTGSFEAMLWKTDATHGGLHLYRNRTQDANFKFGGTVTVIADHKVTVSAPNLQTLATTALPGQTGQVVGTLLSGQAQTAVNGWVSDAQTRITNWLKPFQQNSTDLQITIDNSTNSFLLLDFAIDLSASGFGTAFSKAMGGDYVAALAVPNSGLTLAIGSGLENFHTQMTSISFKLFGKFDMEWSVASIANYSIQYVGNNTFHLVENIGRTLLSSIGNSSTQIDVYFAATANTTPAGFDLESRDLHLLLKAVNNPRFAGFIATIFSGQTTGPLASALNKQLLALVPSKQASETLTMTFSPTSYGNLQSSTWNGGRPILDEAADQSNFGRFAFACQQLNSLGSWTVPALQYNLWKSWTVAYQGGDLSAGGQPNRRTVDNYTAGETFLGGQFNGGPISQIGYCLRAASCFMNLCEDLKHLATSSDNTSWNQMIANMKIVLSDITNDFISPTFLALTYALDNSGTQPAITGPVAQQTTVSSIALQLDYA